MKNFVQEGKNLDFTAPAGGVVAGHAQLRGTILHIAATTAAEGERYAGWLVGVYTLPCSTGTAWQGGQTILYWDDANKRVSHGAAGNVKIGIAADDKIAADATGNVRLIPTI